MIKLNRLKISALFCIAIFSLPAFSEVLTIRRSGVFSDTVNQMKKTGRIPTQEVKPQVRQVGYKYIPKGYADEELFDAVDRDATIDSIVTKTISGSNK